MSEQITKEQLFGGIAAPSEPHMACVLLLDILPEFHVRSFGDYDSPDIYSLPSGIAGAAPDGLLEGICTDGSRLLASFLSRQLAECV